MRTTRINTGRHVLEYRVVAPDVKLEVHEMSFGANPQEFKRIWRQAETDFKAPPTPWAARESQIARRLEVKWGVDKLSRLVREFFYRHARSMGVFDGKHDRSIVLFASAIPTIVNELGDL